MQYEIRKMLPEEYPLLNAFLYQAIFIPEGIAPPPYEIIFSRSYRFIRGISGNLRMTARSRLW